MGSGDRVKLYRGSSFGLGVCVAPFPFAVTFSVHVFLWIFSVGFGKGYDE